MAQKELCNFETGLHSYIQKQPIQHLMDKFSLSFTTVIRLKKGGDTRIPISGIPSLLREINNI